MTEHSIERIKADLYKLEERAEQTRKRTRSSEDRDLVMLINIVLVSLWGQSPDALDFLRRRNRGECSESLKFLHRRNKGDCGAELKFLRRRSNRRRRDFGKSY